MKSEFETFTLSNGLRMVHKKVKSPVAHACLMINTGTRDELPHEQGLAHFIEHTLFKGTQKHNAHYILNRLENVGGELNAYTAKEETCIYATFLQPYLRRAIDLLAEITFLSSFPEKEIEKEKSVIADEIASYKDSPAEEIYDRFEAFVFPNHPLGYDILGTEESLLRFSGDTCRQFVGRNYRLSEMVFAYVGPQNFPTVRQTLERWFEKNSPAQGAKKPPRLPPPQFQPFQQKIDRKLHQVHYMMGAEAYNIHHSQRTALVLINNILGGPAMNSLLSMELREKKGYTYNIESGYVAYSDAGVWHVYFGTDQKYAANCEKTVKKVLRKLCEKALIHQTLERAKKQLIGQIAISRENNNALMMMAAKHTLLFNQIESFEDSKRRILELTPKSLQEVANEIFDTKKLSTLVIY